MDKKEFAEILKEKAHKIDVDLSENQVEKFYDYMNLLIEWNKNINLTAITEPKEIIEKHFIDSLSILKYVKKENKILDIGTGAGFPGIPLKIVLEKQNITLLDSLNKRIIFLNELINVLQLDRVYAIHGRAEEFNRRLGERENYDVVVSRAVAKLVCLVEYMIPFVKVGGKCICMKAMDIEEEINEANNAINKLGGKIEQIDEFVLPGSNISRKIVIISKIKNTPKQYPRKAGKPNKEPIK